MQATRSAIAAQGGTPQQLSESEHDEPHVEGQLWVRALDR